MRGAITVGQLAKFNDSKKVKFRCMIFGHGWDKPQFTRLIDNRGTHLCELQACKRCERFKIGKIIKPNLNRKARRR